MSNKSHKPIRQEYIAKVRYINNLPPPPLNPKFLQYNTTERKSINKENEELMSSLFRKENFGTFLEQIDEEYGLNLNLINNTGFLDNGDESVIYDLKQQQNQQPVQLHPNDRVLLRDAGIGNISKSEPGVSFLRRTEYIAERQLPKTPHEIDEINNNNNTDGQSNDIKKAIEEDNDHSNHDPASQLLAVERTFDQAQETLNDLTKLKHPKKKHLKAVSTWSLLPDTSMMDSKFLNVKFSGSASINRELQALKKQKNYNEEYQKDSLLSTIYKPITSEDGEWISLYQLSDEKKAKLLREKLNSTDREQPVNLLDEDENNLEEFKFKHNKYYDMQYNRYTKPYEELAIKFLAEKENQLEEPQHKKRKVALYHPISGRIILKKNRASTNTEINRFLKESTVDIINFKLREPNTNELRLMDNARSEFDPMEYEGEEDEEEEEEETGDVADEFNQATKSGEVKGDDEN